MVHHLICFSLPKLDEDWYAASSGHSPEGCFGKIPKNEFGPPQWPPKNLHFLRRKNEWEPHKKIVTQLWCIIYNIPSNRSSMKIDMQHLKGIPQRGFSENLQKLDLGIHSGLPKTLFFYAEKMDGNWVLLLNIEQNWLRLDLLQGCVSCLRQ